MSSNAKTLPSLNGLSTPSGGDSSTNFFPSSEEHISREPIETPTATSGTDVSSFQLLSSPNKFKEPSISTRTFQNISGGPPSRSRTLFGSSSTATPVPVPASTQTVFGETKMGSSQSSTTSQSNSALSSHPTRFDGTDSIHSQFGFSDRTLTVDTNDSATNKSGTADDVGTLFGIRKRHGMGEAKIRDGTRRPPSLPPPKTSRLSTVFGHTGDAFASSLTQTQISTHHHALKKSAEETTGLSKSSEKHHTISTSAQPQDYSKWIVVYGFTDWRQCQSMLSRFESFGTISSRYPSSPFEERNVKSNWICLRYDSALQADKAFCQHGAILDANSSGKEEGWGDRHQCQQGMVNNEVIILGVMRVDIDIAVRLGLRNYIEFGSSVSHRDRNVVPLTVIGSNGKIAQPKILLGENDVLLNGVDDTTGRRSRDKMSIGAVNIVGHQSGLVEYLLTWMFSW